MAADCLFCKIVSGEIAADVVHRDDALIAFKDINPQAPVHVLIVPHRRIPTLLDLEPEDQDLVGGVFTLAKRLAKEQGIDQDGFRVVVNCGAAAGQSVYHIHFHLMGGRTMSWPPG